METSTYKIYCGMGTSNDWPFEGEIKTNLNSIGYSGKLPDGTKMSLYEYLQSISTPQVSYTLQKTGGNGFEFTDEYLLVVTKTGLSNHQLNEAEEAIIALSKALSITEKQVIEIINDGMLLNTKGKMTTEYQEFIDEMTATFDAY